MVAEIHSLLNTELTGRGLQHGRVLILAHRQELIWQAADKIQTVIGVHPDIEMGEYRASRHGQLTDSHVVVSSIQSQIAGKTCQGCEGTGFDSFNARECIECFGYGRTCRMFRFDPMEFSLVVIDEAHRAVSDTYRRILAWYKRNPNLKVLMVSATPDRSDGKALGGVCDSVAFEYSLNDAITDGWLVPIHQEIITVHGLDFSEVRTKAGDLDNTQLENILVQEENLHGVVNPTMELAGDRQCLIFAASVDHAERIAEIINRHRGGSAKAISGKTNKEVRRGLLKSYSNREFQYLVNCAVFTEGFDEPKVSVVSVARPTKSRSLYTQIVGRGTRPIVPPSIHHTAEERRAVIQASEKPFCTILDFVGNAGRHKLVSTLDILGGDEPEELILAVKAKIQEAESTGAGIDPRKAIEDEKESRAKAAEEKQKAEEARRAAIKAKVEYSRSGVNPFDLWEIPAKKELPWQRGKMPSEAQIAMLQRHGVDTEGLSLVEASRIIGEIKRRRDEGLCTYKQARLLKRNGLDPNVSFSVASRIIDGIMQKAKASKKLHNKMKAVH